MFFGIKALIVGDFILKEPICTYAKGYKVSIFIEDGKYKISVIKLIPNDSPLQIHYKVSGEFTGPIAPDESTYEDYIKLLQDIEALGGLNYGITKIFYRETLELCWYTGTDIFQNLNLICSLQRKYTPSKKKVLSQSNLSSILLLKKLVPEAKVPYTYYREANVFLQNQEYRLAYVHFFMLLEFCFTTHTKEKEVISDFIGSAELNLALLDTLKTTKDCFAEVYENVKIKSLKDFNYLICVIFTSYCLPIEVCWRTD